MKVLSFFNYKGGVGKTTSAVSLSYLLSRQNKRVLIVDLDAQCNSTNDFNAVDMKQLRDYAFQGIFDFQEESAFNVLTDANYDITKAIHKTRYENLDIIPSIPTLDNANVYLMNMLSSGQNAQFNLRNQLKKLEGNYDYVILDNAPHKDLIATNSLVASDYLYVPIMPDPNSSIGLALAINFMKEVQGSLNPNLKFGGAFFASFHENHNADKEECEALQHYIADNLIDVKIPESTNIKKMHQQQKQLLEINPNHNTTIRYIELTEFIINQTKD